MPASLVFLLLRAAQVAGPVDALRQRRVAVVAHVARAVDASASAATAVGKRMRERRGEGMAAR
jgi:hypothetical protein